MIKFMGQYGRPNLALAGILVDMCVRLSVCVCHKGEPCKEHVTNDSPDLPREEALWRCVPCCRAF